MRRSALAFALVFLSIAAIAAPADLSPAWQIVYTRQPRATAPVPGTPIMEAANWQHATDVARINGGIAEADVVIDDLQGHVKVIHNCTNSKAICVAQEARVSPDGTKIVYSVGLGNTLVPVTPEGIDLGILEIPVLTDAQLWVYDLATGKSAPIPHRPPQAIDRQPEWLDNKKIVFTSNRGNTYPFKFPWGAHQGLDQFGNGRCFNAPYCVSQEYGYGLEARSMQLWTMNIDGTDARNITPHENNALAPAVMTNGDIVYSCWNAHENRNFDASSGNSNNAGTAANKWWLCRTDGNGADGTVILNAHKSPYLSTGTLLPPAFSGGDGISELRAVRSVAEIFKGKLAITNYYRANHVGSMGVIFGMDYRDPHVEGCSTLNCFMHRDVASTNNSTVKGSGRYIPSTFKAITPFGQDQDDTVRFLHGKAVGKAGYPAPYNAKEFLITYGAGNCYEVTLAEQANRKWTGGQPTCQKSIYKVKVPMVTNPFDKNQMEQIAGGNPWHAWDARPITTYQALYGRTAPARPKPLDETGACYLQVVDARKAELYPSAERYDWRTNLFEQCAFQGCAVNTENPNFHARSIANLTVFLPEMWDMTYSDGNEETYARTLNNTGHKSIATLGSAPLQADGSVKMRVPCETPIIMTGTDANGLVIAHDAMLHSLRRGESRTCHGCHDGHSQERAAQLGQSAAQRFERTLAYQTTPPMPQKTPPVTFAAVEPILVNRCSGCHKDMTNADGLLYSRVAQDFEQWDWPWVKLQPAQGEHASVVNVRIGNRGKGYVAGDTLQFQPGGAAGTVAAVGPAGGILAIRLIAGGDGYAPLTPVTVKSARGSGAHLVAMTDRFFLSRPYSSKWVAKFARDSLLYWKCIGSRQDGRTDAQYNNDIDFGAAHPSGATPAECRVIGRWIDTGIQN